MYTNYFGLRHSPFEDRADPQFTFMTAELEETLAALEYEAHYDHGMALVLGEAGVGKTQLIRALLLQLHTTDHVVVVNRTTNGDLNVLRETCKGFGVSLGTESRADQQLARLRRHLTRNAKVDHCSVLIVDHAEHLTVEELKQLVALNDIHENTVKLLTVILAGQPRVLVTLAQPGLEQLDQKLFHRRTIQALSASDTDRYINHRLCVAGAVESHLFEADAVAAIHRATAGVPRLINRVCHSAMIAAYGADTRRIHAGVVSEVLGGEIVQERTSAAATVTTRGADAEAASAALRRGIEIGRVTAPTEEAYGLWDHDDPIGERKGALDPGTYAAHAAYRDDLNTQTTDEEYATERLHRCLSHAERVCTTTDAKLTQLSAIEKHLSTLAQSAERLIAGLNQGIRQTGHSFEQFQTRMDATLADAERRISDIDARATRALEVGRNLSDNLVRAETECDRAKEVSTRLGSFADQLADSVDDMQSRTAPLLDTIHSAGEIQNRLEASCRKATATATQIDAQFQIDERRLRGRLTDLQQEAQRVVTDAATHVQAQLQAGERKLQERLAVLQKEAQRITTETVTQAEAQLHSSEQKFRERFAELQRETDILATDAVERIRQTLGDTETSVTSAADRAAERATAAADSLQGVLEPFEARCENLQGSTDALIERVGNASLQVGHLSETAKSVGDDARDLVERVTRVRNEATPLIDRVEQVIDRINGAHLDAETLRRTLAERLVDIGRACEQTEKLTQRTESCRQAVDQVLGHREWLQSMAGTLSTRIRDAEQCMRILDGAEARASEIKSAVAAVQTAGGELDKIRGALEPLLARADQSKQALVDALASSEEQFRSVRDSIDSGSKTAGELTNLNKLAVELHDAMQGLVAHADEKIGRLDSHSAAAGRILREISEANKQGQKIVDRTEAQIIESRELADVAGDKIARLTEDIGSWTKRSEANRLQLVSELDSARELLDKIRAATGPAQQAAAMLADQVAQAGTASAAIAAQTTMAQEQLAVLTEVAPQLDAIRETDESMRRTAEEVRRAREELTEALADAAEHASSLGRLSASASTLIETQHQLAGRMENMTRQFDDKIADTKTAVVTGEELLAEFIAQGDTINARLTQLAQQTDAIGRHVGGLLEEPVAVVAEAKAQSERLTKICAAVRKVFAGLSQATLEAREQTEQLRLADDSSTEQLVALTTRTQQASATLQEWVEEAVRVQTRLERAIGECPTIRQTHPGDNVAGLGRVVSASVKSVRTLDGELVVSGAAVEANAAVNPMAQNAPISSPRARDIAKMIEEAKRAKAAGAK